MSTYIGHITIAGIVTFSGVFFGITLVIVIIYARVIAFTGGHFGTGFFKFMAVAYGILLAALIFGFVDLPCSLSIIPALPNGWTGNCPSYTPPVPGI